MFCWSSRIEIVAFLMYNILYDIAWFVNRLGHMSSAQPATCGWRIANFLNILEFAMHRVSGFTMVSAAFQSINRASATSVIRVASVARRDLTRRSTYSASCFRRKRFSAASRDRERTPSARNVSASTSRQPKVPHTLHQDNRFRMRQHAIPTPQLPPKPR